MSTCLCIHIYGPSMAPSATLGEVLGVLAAAGATRWSTLTVRGPQAHQVRLEGGVPATLDAVLEAIAATPFDDTEAMAVRAALPCWRVGDAGMEYSWVAVEAQVLGDAYGVRNHEDLRLCGVAQLTFAPIRPYCVDVTGAQAPYNEKVEANLQELLGVVTALARRLAPVSIKVFADAGLYLPINAHAAYYRDNAAALDDLRYLQEVWHAGLPGHRIPPLGEIPTAGVRAALHEWRSPEQTAALWQRLRACIDHAPQLDDLQWALTSQRFDTLTDGASFIVLELPHFVNAFVDRFFVEALEHAGGAQG